MNLQNNGAEAYSVETFDCGNCGKEFQARIITWVDVTRAPQARRALLKWDFNIVECSHCGCRHFSGTPFFYEDFEEGLLVAVFPRIPEQRGETEESIRVKYGYYPVLEFFYDMTQVWMLIYLQDYYKVNKNLRTLSRLGSGEERLRKILRFLKEDHIMIDIREKLTESFFGDATNDELLELLGQAVYRLEEMLPWPKDTKCRCGADLSAEFKCCGSRVNLDDHKRLLSRHYVVYCPECREALIGASCEACGSVYTWKIGIVDSYKQDLQMLRDSGMPKKARAGAQKHFH